MKRQQIFDKVEEIWYKCQDRNIGSNEAELDFRETVTDWIQEQLKTLGLFSVSQRCATCINRIYYPDADYRYNRNKCNLSKLYITDVDNHHCEKYESINNVF